MTSSGCNQNNATRRLLLFPQNPLNSVIIQWNVQFQWLQGGGRYQPSLGYHFIGANADHLPGRAASTMYFNVTSLPFCSRRVDLTAILTEVNNEVAGKELEGCKQMPKITSTLLKRLIFEVPQ